MPGKPKGDPVDRARPTARGIRAARGWSDLTAQQLADKVGVNIRLVQKWEAGTRTPTGEQIEAAAQACGVPEWVAAGSPPTFLLWPTTGRGTP